MGFLEQENRVLHEEIAAMRTKMEEMTEKMRTMVAAQAQTPPPPVRTQAEASSSAIPEWTICVDTPTHPAPQRSTPWFPPLTAGEILCPIACEARMPTHQHAPHVPPPLVRAPPVNMTYSAPVIHTIPQNEEPIYHSGNVQAYDRVNDLLEKYNEMQREMRTLRGKEIFGKTSYDLCLVPNVQIPHKFKVPDFEKYKGNSCLEEHLTMYVKRMSAYAKDDQVLIFYFQESLASPASKWYMNLDKTEIRTFRDLCEAFVQQYQYKVDMAPDRSDLQAMTQKDRETFREYAQRWRDTAAQVSPRMEEKEMTKLFLKTLNQFYYEKMVGSAPKNFAEMVGMGVQLEEGVREGRLVRISAPTNSEKTFGNNFPEKKEQEVSMVAHGGPQPHYPVYQQIAPISVKYADLLPQLLELNLVQTKVPPPVPARLPTWYKPDLFCDFHQGAPGHDIEHCHAMKNAVQSLIRTNHLAF